MCFHPAHIESEVRHVPIVHQVVLAFDPQEALGAAPCLGAVVLSKSANPAKNLGLDEAAFEVGVE